MTDPKPLPPDEWADLQKCRSEVDTFVADLVSRYDVRAVTACLGGAYAIVSATAIAAGMRQVTLEILAGTLNEFFAPPEKAPVVYYKDKGELLGRKQ